MGSTKDDATNLPQEHKTDGSPCWCEPKRVSYRETEYEAAIQLAEGVLNHPHRDPDSDLSMLARQFLRMVERERLRGQAAKVSG